MDTAFQLGVVTGTWAVAVGVILFNVYLATVIVDWVRAKWL